MRLAPLQAQLRLLQRSALTGMYSGSHSGMLRLPISMEIFLRCPGLVTPMAVRSCRADQLIRHVGQLTGNDTRAPRLSDDAFRG